MPEPLTRALCCAAAKRKYADNPRKAYVASVATGHAWDYVGPRAQRLMSRGLAKSDKKARKRFAQAAYDAVYEQTWKECVGIGVIESAILWWIIGGIVKWAVAELMAYWFPNEPGARE